MLFLMVTVVLLVLLGLPGSLFCQEKENQGKGAFYYADGKKITLEVAVDYMAVRLKPGAVARKFMTWQGNIPEFSLWQTVEHLQKYRTVLFKLDKEKSKAIKSVPQFKIMFKERPEVETLIPVYRSGPGKFLLILTDEFLARFRDGVSSVQVDEFNKKHGVEIVKRDRYDKNLFILKVTSASKGNALEIANLYYESDITLWAAPNFLSEVRKSFEPEDPYFYMQWHLKNTGKYNGPGEPGGDSQ
jgi:hypothetical protein